MTLRKEIRKEIWGIIFKHKAALIINLLVLGIVAFSGPFSLYSQAYFIDSLKKMVGTDFIIYRFIPPALLLLLSFLLPMLNIATNFMSMKYEHSIELSWNKRMYELISEIPYYRYEHEETYDKIKQLGDNNIYAAFISCIICIVSTTVAILFYLIILINISLWLAVSIMILAPVTGYFTSKIADKQYKRTFKMNPDRRRGIYKSSILHSNEYVKEIRVNRCADYMLDDWQNTQKDIDIKVLKIKFKYGFLSALVLKIEYIVVFINLVIVLFSYLNGNISVGVFISVSNQIFSMKMLSKIHNLVTQITTTKSLQKIYSEVLDLAQKTNLNRTGICISEPVTIEFRDVSFKYPQQEKFILDHINLCFSSNESVAIVGENGAGKSTLIKLLIGLYVPNEGEIFVNNNNLKDLSLKEKSEIFGVAFQDYFKFNLSLKENIALGEEENPHIEIPKCLKINELADSLSNGYATVLGKSFGNGVDVSGGQWQEIAIARSLIGNKKVFIFDEPTAAFDPIREVGMFESIKANTQGRIAIFITHRLGFTTKTNRILLIKNGHIIADGDFNNLIKENGEFTEMFEIQKSLYSKENIK